MFKIEYPNNQRYNCYCTFSVPSTMESWKIVENHGLHYEVKYGKLNIISDFNKVLSYKDILPMIIHHGTFYDLLKDFVGRFKIEYENETDIDIIKEKLVRGLYIKAKEIFKTDISPIVNHFIIEVKNSIIKFKEITFNIGGQMLTMDIV